MKKTDINQEITHGNFGLEKVLKALWDESLSRYPGNIYYVVKSTESYYSTFYETFYKKYSDNSVSIHTTIQSAVDASTEDRGDLVLVMPGKWQENVLILDKDALKIKALANGWETQMRPSDATTKYPVSSASSLTVPGFAFVSISRDVEISGFCLDTGGGYGGIYVGDGYRVDTDYGENSASNLIHNNYFRGGGEGVVGVLLDGASDEVRIEDNIFSRATVGVQIDPGGDRQTEYPIIRRNTFFAKNAGYGVDMYNANATVGIEVSDNNFRDGTSQAFTYAIRFQGTGVHSTIGNHFACANKISAASTDFCSGDFFHSAGNAPHFVQDSTNSA